MFMNRYFFFNNKTLLKITNHGIRHTRRETKIQPGSYRKLKESNLRATRTKGKNKKLEQPNNTITTLRKQEKPPPCY
jgi:hypothetical protein